MMSKVKPHILLGDKDMIVALPYHRQAIQDLWTKIPKDEVRFNKKAGFFVLKCTEVNYNIAKNSLEAAFGDVLIFDKKGKVQDYFKLHIDPSDYYTLLKVPDNATPEEIKKSYRKIALRVHPDRGGNPEHFHLVQKAYEVLANPKKRKRYDLARGITAGAPLPPKGTTFRPAAGGPTGPSPSQVRTPFGVFAVKDRITSINAPHPHYFTIDIIDTKRQEFECFIGARSLIRGNIPFTAARHGIFQIKKGMVFLHRNSGRYLKVVDTQGNDRVMTKDIVRPTLTELTHRFDLFFVADKFRMYDTLRALGHRFLKFEQGDRITCSGTEVTFVKYNSSTSQPIVDFGGTSGPLLHTVPINSLEYLAPEQPKP